MQIRIPRRPGDGTASDVSDMIIVMTDNVSEHLFGGNIYVDVSRVRGNRRSWNLRVKFHARDSYGMGARQSASGRHGPWACWHAVRDVLAAWFDMWPDMVATSGLGRGNVRYIGAEHFGRNFPVTYFRNVGSDFQPMNAGSCCECYEDANDAATVQDVTTPQPTARKAERPRRGQRSDRVTHGQLMAGQSEMARDYMSQLSPVGENGRRLNRRVAEAMANSEAILEAYGDMSTYDGRGVQPYASPA